MLFHIVVMVYVIVSGHPIVDEPTAVSHRRSFGSIEACQTYLKSEQFSEEREDFTATIRSGMKVPLAEESDEAPDFALTTTASCEEDGTL